MRSEFRFAALMLCGICAVVFALSWLFPGFFYGNFTLVSSLVADRPWTVLTYMFMHGSAVHLLSNIFALGLFGSVLERYIGWKRFLLVFFAAGIISSLGNVLWYEETLGASGAVFGVMGALATLRPRLVVWALGVPMYIIVAALVWAFLDMMGVFYPDNIAHMAHLFGLAFGMAAGLWLRRKYPAPKKRKEKKIEISEESLRQWEDRYMFARACHAS